MANTETTNTAAAAGSETKAPPFYKEGAWQGFLTWKTDDENYPKEKKPTLDLRLIYIDITGDHTSACVLAQIIYWHLPEKEKKQGTKLQGTKLQVVKHGKYWLSKSEKEWFEETRLRDTQVKRALDLLEEKGIIEVATMKYDGRPTRHVRILPSGLVSAMNQAINNPPKFGEPTIRGSKAEQGRQRNKAKRERENALKEQNGNLSKRTIQSALETSLRAESNMLKEQNGNPSKSELDSALKAHSLTETTTKITTESTTEYPYYTSYNKDSSASQTSFASQKSRGVDNGLSSIDGSGLAVGDDAIDHAQARDSSLDSGERSPLHFGGEGPAGETTPSAQAKAKAALQNVKQEADAQTEPFVESQTGYCSAAPVDDGCEYFDDDEDDGYPFSEGYDAFVEDDDGEDGDDEYTSAPDEQTTALTAYGGIETSLAVAEPVAGIGQLSGMPPIIYEIPQVPVDKETVLVAVRILIDEHASDNRIFSSQWRRPHCDDMGRRYLQMGEKAYRLYARTFVKSPEATERGMGLFQFVYHPEQWGGVSYLPKRQPFQFGA